MIRNVISAERLPASTRRVRPPDLFVSPRPSHGPSGCPTLALPTAPIAPSPPREEPLPRCRPRARPAARAPLSLTRLNAVKYTKCLKKRVEVRLRPERADLLEVRVVDVGVDAKEAGEDLAHHTLEVFGEGRVALRKRLGVIHLSLHRLGVIDVFGGAARDGFLPRTPSAHRYSYLGPAHIVGPLRPCSNRPGWRRASRWRCKSRRC